MQEDPRNYGRPQEAGDGPDVTGRSAGRVSGSPSGMSPQDEQTWSALSHASFFLNIFTGFVGPLVALGIWFFYRGRSEEVAFHALQSLWYQVAWLIVMTVGWSLTTILTAVTFGLLGVILVPLMLVPTVVPFIQAAIATYRTSKGRDYRYPWVASRVENGQRGIH